MSSLSINKTYFENDKFQGINFSQDSFVIGEYEKCTFENCIFTKANLSEIIFSNCVFINCDLSLAKVNNTAIRDIKFKGCKLLGLHFEDCNQFGLAATFEDCILNLASFYKVNLKSFGFTNCSLIETDFTQSDLRGIIFEKCNFAGAIFDHTNLEKDDFSTSFNFSIDPEKNKIKKAKFSITGIIGLLDKYDIIIE
jgi:fluoroquinolone resistance protein